MYTIELDGTPFYDPRYDEVWHLQNPVLNLEYGRLGTLSFTIYEDNPNYDSIHMLTSVLTVYRDGTPIFRARPIYRKRLFKGGVEWKCEEIFGRLNDVLVRPNNGIADDAQRAFELYMGIYTQKTGDTSITLGNMDDLRNFSAYTITFDYPGTYKFLSDAVSHIPEDDKPDTTIAVNLVHTYTDVGQKLEFFKDEHLPLSTQPIEFGLNMADMFIEQEFPDDDSFVTSIVPISRPVQQEGYDQQIPVKADGTSQGDPNDYIANQSLVAQYGYIERTHTFPEEMYQDTDLGPSLLYSAGQSYINNYGGPKFKRNVQLSAVDLHNLDVNIEALTYMTRVPVKSTLHDIDETYVIRKMEIPLGAPDKARIELGNQQSSLTDILEEKTK